jgi:hypothetical protein
MWLVAVSLSGTVPVLHSGWEHTTSPGRISSNGPSSRCTASGGVNERLPKRMDIPRVARARLEGDERQLQRRVQAVDAEGAGEVLGRPFSRRLRTCANDVHAASIPWKPGEGRPSREANLATALPDN